MSESKMQRGAREANEESQAARLGQAVGGLSAFIRAINDLTARVEKLEQRVAAQEKGLPAPGTGESTS